MCICATQLATVAVGEGKTVWVTTRVPVAVGGGVGDGVAVDLDTGLGVTAGDGVVPIADGSRWAAEGTVGLGGWTSQKMPRPNPRDTSKAIKLNKNKTDFCQPLKFASVIPVNLC